MKPHWLPGVLFIAAGILVIVRPNLIEWLLGIVLILVGIVSLLRR